MPWDCGLGFSEQWTASHQNPETCWLFHFCLCQGDNSHRSNLPKTFVSHSTALIVRKLILCTYREGSQRDHFLELFQVTLLLHERSGVTQKCQDGNHRDLSLERILGPVLLKLHTSLLIMWVVHLIIPIAVPLVYVYWFLIDRTTFFSI